MTLSASARRTVETMLSVRFSTRVRVAGVEDFPYSQVSRCALEAAGSMVPPTVIVRVLRDHTARSHPARLHNEQAALEFLNSIGSALAPRFIAGDATAGILITEDLGPHPSLLDLLLGDDREAARRGFYAFARSLGTLHAQTIGYASVYDDHRTRRGPYVPTVEHPAGHPPVVESWRQVRDAVAQLGLPEPRGVDGDVEEIARILDTPGPYLAFSNGDPSPVNCSVAHGTVRFFDFEEAVFHHALLDAIILRYPYPTGGPVWRLPPEIADSIEPAYRDELARACPIALDDASYQSGMAAASAAWTVVRMVRLVKVETGPDRDSWLLLPPGWFGAPPTRSRRRQLVAIIETCIASARRADTLPALAAWCDRTVSALRTRWPEATEAIPLYPAFTD